MSEEDTIKIKKNSLWKYTSIVLLLVILVGGFFLLKEKNVTDNAVISPGTQDPVNLNVFTNNPALYPSLGPEDADTVIIEFSDFQCPYCALASGLPDFADQYATQYADLIDSAGKVQKMAEDGDVRFIYVPMSFLGEESVYAAQAGLCANNQGKFWEMHDVIFETHDGKENNGKYSKDNLKKMAKTISGLDASEFNKCLDNDETLAYVQEASSTAGSIVSGTPTFFVNGQKVSASWSQISSLI